MPGQQFTGSDKPFIHIVQGSVVKNASPEAEGARQREYKTPKGEEGSKWEFVYANWTGLIQSIRIRAGKYGDNLEIELEDAVLSVPVKSRYFENLAGKLFNVDLAQEVTFHPYDFEVDGGRKVGVSVQQNGEKLDSYFWRNGKVVDGFPIPDKEQISRRADGWGRYYADVQAYLMDEIEKKFMEPEQPDQEPNEPKEDTQIDDLPF